MRMVKGRAYSLAPPSWALQGPSPATIDCPEAFQKNRPSLAGCAAQPRTCPNQAMLRRSMRMVKGRAYSLAPPRALFLPPETALKPLRRMGPAWQGVLRSLNQAMLSYSMRTVKVPF